MNRFELSPRGRWATLCETKTREELEAHGHKVMPYGQQLLDENTRRVMQSAKLPDLQRWLPDFYVLTAKHEHCYVDSKYHEARYINQSIEMRSILYGKFLTHSYYYACSVLSDDSFGEFASINSSECELTWGCCNRCVDVFHSSTDPVVVSEKLPVHCDNHKGYGSKTPYFVVTFPDVDENDFLFGHDKRPAAFRPGGIVDGPGEMKISKPAGYTDKEWDDAVSDARRLGYWK